MIEKKEIERKNNKDNGDINQTTKYTSSIYLQRFSLVVMVFLLIGVFDLPYGYYTFLRIMTCGSCIVNAIFFFSQAINKVGAFGSVVVAVLFNPIVPIHLDKTVWILLDIVVALFMVYIWYEINKNAKGKLKNE